METRRLAEFPLTEEGSPTEGVGNEPATLYASQEMAEVDRLLRDKSLITREMVLDAGGSDDLIGARVRRGWWTPVHAGVYRIGPPDPSWLKKLEAALLAAGKGAVVSHRSAWYLWGLDGLTTQLVEITVPYVNSPVPKGVLRHRTRRPIVPEVKQGLRVTPVERTLLDVSPLVPKLVLAKGVDSALRVELTTPQAIARVVADQGGRGVRGSEKLLSVIGWSERTGTTGSPAETELLAGMRKEGLPEPVPQWRVTVPSGQTYYVDFGWPSLRKGVEVDGLEAHTGRESLQRDLTRQNDLLDAGIELRRFTAASVRGDLPGVVSAIATFLAS